MADDGSLLLAGYQACYEDALCYLTEVEGFQENDPVVVGLKEYLFEQRRQLYLSLILEKTRDGMKENFAFREAHDTNPRNCTLRQPIGDDKQATRGCDTPPVANSFTALQTESSFEALLQNNPDLVTLTSELLSLLEEDSLDWEDDISD